MGEEKKSLALYSHSFSCVCSIVNVSLFHEQFVIVCYNACDFLCIVNSFFLIGMDVRS